MNYRDYLQKISVRRDKSSGVNYSLEDDSEYDSENESDFYDKENENAHDNYDSNDILEKESNYDEDEYHLKESQKLGGIGKFEIDMRMIDSCDISSDEEHDEELILPNSAESLSKLRSTFILPPPSAAAVEFLRRAA